MKASRFATTAGEGSVVLRPVRAPRDWTIGSNRSARLLYFTRSAGYVHSVVRRNGSGLAHSETILTELGRQCGVEVIATKDGRVFDGDLSSYDAIAFYTLGDLTRESGESTPPMSPKGKQRLLAAIAAGKGFLGFHSACDTFLSREDQVDPYIAMLGGEFVTHDRPQQAALEVVGPDFPGIGALGGSLAMYEEWYALKNFAPDLRVILVQRTDDMIGGCYGRPPFPVTWARMHGKGRFFTRRWGTANAPGPIAASSKSPWQGSRGSYVGSMRTSRLTSTRLRRLRINGLESTASPTS